ncbi:hypothetical protein [Schumannella sp. 10F1B-5-1]|uniref:hypothetical protein n=1 Tax=Schumannella sp. 10F1B-5-1 TaxID=2590780 RepID=UPI00112FDE5E|nr:hypothetical protein [Schumannella sp. 10F1B-5-1]TPW72260.1 hypothetical protein FJ658_08280 [Schumannella sp. 10F1B-5-1]
MSDLKLDLQLLHQLKDDLEAIVKEFKNAEDFSDGVASATGHDELSGLVHDFAEKWNIKREKMLKNVETLQQQIAAISDNFTSVDKDLAKALEDAAADVAKNNPDAVPS